MSSHPQFVELAALLQPVDAEGFIADHWERERLHLTRGQSHFYQRLISVSNLEKIISDPNARYPAVQLAKHGHYLGPETYTHDLKFGGEVFHGVPDVSRIVSEYRNGASVVLPALHRLSQPMGDLCRRLEAEISHAVHANAYLTPGNASGFTPHYDTHDVLVLQIAGSKRWSLYPSPIRLPHRSQSFDPARYSPTEATGHVDLSAGDLLYLPRGTIHSAATDLSFSVHVTLGISVYTWADLTPALGKACVEDEELRRALPPGFATRIECRPVMQRQLRTLFDKLEIKGDVDPIVDSFINRVRSRVTASGDLFHADVISIDAHSQLVAPAASQYRIVREPGHTRLEYEGRRHLLPPETAEPLRFLTSRAAFQTYELPNSLSHEAKLGLSRYLLEIGFLKLQR